MSADSQVPLSIDPDTDHPIAGDAVLYTAINDAAFGGTVEESYQDPAPSLTWRFRIVGHQGLFNHSAEAWRSRIISRPAPEPEPQWEPGTVAVATVRGAKGIRVIRATNTGGSDPHEMDPTWISADLVDRGHKVNGYDGTYLHHDEDVTDVRPLVVIDPAAVDVDALVAAAHTDRVLYGDTTPDQMRGAALRMLAVLGIEAAR